MPTLAVRDIDEDSYAALVAVAKENGRSVSAQVRDMVDELARKRRGSRDIIAEINEHRRRVKPKISGGLDSVALIRLIRDEE